LEFGYLDLEFAACCAVQSYHWPGNVRELENVIERAVIVSTGKKLVLGEWLSTTEAPSDKSEIPTLEELERNHILEVLEMTDWRVSGEKGAAKILGRKRTTLEARMQRLGIRRERSKVVLFTFIIFFLCISLRYLQ